MYDISQVAMYDVLTSSCTAHSANGEVAGAAVGAVQPQPLCHVVKAPKRTESQPGRKGGGAGLREVVVKEGREGKEVNKKPKEGSSWGVAQHFQDLMWTPNGMCTSQSLCSTEHATLPYMTVRYS